MSISVTINGKDEILSKGLSVLDVLKQKNISNEMFVIEKNHVILDKDKYSEPVLEGDKIEILSFFGGG